MYIIDVRSKLSFELTDGAIIGRDPASDIRVEDKSVSRAHAQVEVRDDRTVVLRDLGSSRGTFCNEERVEEVDLAAGMELRFGGARFEVVAEVQLESFDPRVVPIAQLRFRPASDIWNQDELAFNYERLRALFELDRALVEASSVDGVLHRILDTAFDLLPAERGVIQLFEAAGVPRTATRSTFGHPEDEVHLSATVVNGVVEEKKGMIVADALVHEELGRAESIVADGIRSVMCVPLIHGSDVLGVMQIDSCHTTHAFESRDLALFSVIASSAAARLGQMNAAQSERLQVVGQVARRLAGDIRNLMDELAQAATVLDGNGDEASQTVARAIAQATSKAGFLLEELLPLDANGDQAEVDRTLAGCLDALRSADGLLARIEAELAAADAAVDLSPEELSGIVRILVRNAVDAVQNQGTVWVRSRLEGTSVRIEVQDDGVGIPSEILPRLFEPLFTTKSADDGTGPKGTGLGLSTVRSVVEGHGGRVEVSSEPGQGARFALFLPARSNADFGENGRPLEPPRPQGEMERQPR